MSRSTLALLFVALVPATVAAEQFYKWKDDSGAWNYTEQPPKDKPSVAVNLATGTASGQTGAAERPPGEAAPVAPAAPAPAPPPGGNPPAKKDLVNTPIAEVAEQRARAQAERNANCERARANVTTLENSPRVTMNKDDGYGERTLSDNEQLEELQKARRQAEVFCNSQ